MAERKTLNEQKSFNTSTYYEDIEVDVKFEKEFNVGDSRTIRIISETEAWVRSDKLNKLVKDSGNMKRSLDSKCLLYTFAVSEDGITYFCDPDDNDVKQVDKQGEVSTLFSVTPLIPSYINLTRSGDLLITLGDEDSYVRNSSSRRLVRRTSLTGEALMEYEYERNGKTPLFCRPMRPIEHVNGNICVVNQYEKEPDNYSGTIYGFDSKDDRMIYRLGSSDMTIIEQLLGTVEVDKSRPEIIFEKEFKMCDTSVNCIHLLSENEGWIHPTKTTINHLVGASGNIEKSVDLGCLVYNFAVSEDNTMYFCDNQKTQSVNKIDIHEEITTLFSTAPLIPLEVKLTRCEDLLITLVDEITYDRNSTSRRLVRRTSMTGEAIMEYDNDGTTPLFCRPARPIELHNGNICVINITEKGPVDTVNCFDFKGNVVFKYKGIDNSFNPVDMCCDKAGNIMISDACNRRVYVIDSNFEFVSFLLSNESFTESIFAIDILGRKLWIGSNKTGLIKVFRLGYV